MPDIPVEQALYGNSDSGGYRFLARSPGFHDDWQATAEHLCAGFGDRPADVTCPHAVFARPLNADHVAVVQVADQGSDDAGRPGALAFQVLVLPLQAYRQWIGDPFAVAERFPPPWEARDTLPALTWPEVPLPPRTVTEVQQVLRENDSPTLLGGVQSLVDGGRMFFERPAPATPLLRQLWMLLPDSTRRHLWPASFAFGNSLGFDVVVLPPRPPGASGLNPEAQGYLTEEQAGDYPQGRYELAVQTAAESGDQGQLDALFSRRSSAETLRLAVILAVVFGAVALVANFANRQPHRSYSTLPVSAREKAPTLPDDPPLTKQKKMDQTRQEMVKLLKEVAQRKKIDCPTTPSVEDMIALLDERLPADPKRDIGPVDTLAPGDPMKQLRLLLWKHNVPDFNKRGLNPVELAERLRNHLAPPGDRP